MEDIEYTDSAFDVSKTRVMRELQECIDRSKKGGVDEPIAGLLAYINAHKDFVSTSSCSGRAAVFIEDEDQQRKSTGQWLYASHDTADAEEVWRELTAEPTPLPMQGTVMFKFEPFILHVQCRTLQCARNFLKVALDSGMRNSGIVLGKKLMVAVRMTLKIEAPVAHNGRLLVNREYIDTLCELARQMFQENVERTNKYFDNVQEAFGKPSKKEEKAAQKAAKREADLLKRAAALEARRTRAADGACADLVRTESETGEAVEAATEATEDAEDSAEAADVTDPKQ